MRTLADTTAGSTKAAHVVDKGRQQQRSISHSSCRSCGWTSSEGVPGPSDGVQEYKDEVPVTQQALEVSRCAKFLPLSPRNLQQQYK